MRGGAGAGTDADADTDADAGTDAGRRASTSVCLNTAEGMGATGRAKRNCYRIALREMREAIAAVEIAGRLGYAGVLDDDDDDRQNRIVATLVRLAKP